MNRDHAYYRRKRAKHIARKVRMIQGRRTSHKDLARIAAMDQSEDYSNDPDGYSSEVSDFELLQDDFGFRYWEMENNYYPEESYYYEWLYKQEKKAILLLLLLVLIWE